MDIISYLGEGRFGILLEVCTLEQGMKVAENLVPGRGRNAVQQRAGVSRAECQCRHDHGWPRCEND